MALAEFLILINMKVLLMTILTISRLESMAMARISERFKAPFTGQCRMGTTGDEELQQDETNELTIRGLKLVGDMFRGLNCTPVATAMIQELSVKSSTGEYTEMVTGLIEDRYDFLTVPFKLDTIDDAPLLVGHVFDSTEGRILSTKKFEAKRAIDLWEFVNSFPLELHLYIVIWLCITLSTLDLIAIAIDASGTKFNLTRVVFDNAFYLSAQLIGNGEMRPSTRPAWIVWISWSMFSFVAITGVFLNLIQTDIMLGDQLPVLNRLEQLLDDTSDGNFTHVQPLMISNLPLRQMFEQSSNESVFGRIWSKMKFNNRYSSKKRPMRHNVIDWDYRLYKVNPDSYGMYMGSMAMSFALQVQAGTAALIVLDTVARMAWKAMCFMDAKKVNYYKPVLSSGSFAKGMLVFVYKAEIDVELRERLDLVFQKLSEHGIFTKGVQDVQDGFMADIDIHVSVNSTKCIDAMAEKGRHATWMETKATDVASMKVTIKYLAKLLAVATAVCILEVLFRRPLLVIRKGIKSSRRERRRRKRNNVQSRRTPVEKFV